MFRQCTEDEYAQGAEGGIRYLFALDGFEFQDALDEEGRLRHFVLEGGEDDGEPAFYEADQPTMYELLARYLSGEYEKEAYDLERSPAHEALLDLLELATARARSGDSDFSLDELEEGEYGEEEDEPAGP